MLLVQKLSSALFDACYSTALHGAAQAATVGICRYSHAQRVPLNVSTMGLSEEQHKAVHDGKRY